MSQEQNQKDETFDDIDLMQYVDGELDEITAAALENHFESRSEDAESAAYLKVQALDQMTDITRSYLELEADAAEPRLDAMWEVIGAHLASAEPSPDEVTESRSQTSPTRNQGIWARIVGFLEGYRGHILTGAVAAGAAAAIILAIRPAEQVPKTIVVERPVPVPSTPDSHIDKSQPPEVKLVVDEPTAPEIEELEVNGGSGTVFVMPSEGEDDVSATVIFIDFDEAEGPIL